jgi:hypothetical protein
MKKLILVCGLLTIVSCGYRTPMIEGNKPFVVAGIEKYNDTHSIYTAQDEESGVWNSNGEGNPRIALPSGMYNIGDTIKVFKNK